MQKQKFHVGMRIDEETLLLLEVIVNKTGKNMSAVLRDCVQEQAKRFEQENRTEPQR